MTRKEILRLAEECVCSDRNLQYGDPEDNFSDIAKLWSDYLGLGIGPIGVALMMCLLFIRLHYRGRQLPYKFFGSGIQSKINIYADETQ